MPLTQRVPKLRGFYNRFRIEYQVVNCGKLKRFEDGAKVDIESLREAGLISSASRPVKLLAGGGDPSGVSVSVHRASGAAVAAIERAGGSVTILAPAAQGDAPEFSAGGQDQAP